MPRVRHVVAVGAGKGGVGKSTVAVNLALALGQAGRRVGLLDADIYGPSVPVLVGLEDGQARVRMTAEHQIVPLDALGLSVVSFGFFLGERSPAVWRGPMVGKAVKQFSRGVVWPDLDVVVVDLPPGTGDVPISLSESVVVDGAIVVTTPQRLAAIEAAKAVDLFRKLEVPVLGLVENMSGTACECGRRFHPFGRGGGDTLHRTTGCPLLTRVPFDDHGGRRRLGTAGAPGAPRGRGGRRVSGPGPPGARGARGPGPAAGRGGGPMTGAAPAAAGPHVPPPLLPGEHFGAGLAFLLAGSIGAVFVAPDLARGLSLAPTVVAVTHLFTLGWITTSIMGALYQFLPVALGTPIGSVRLAHASFGLHVAGSPCSSPGWPGPRSVLPVGAAY